MPERPVICASWEDIIKLHNTDNPIDYTAKLTTLQKVFNDTWIRQQSQKGGMAHLVYKWLASCGKLNPLDRLFLLGDTCSVLSQLPGGIDRKNDALRRLRCVDAYWRTFFSAEFEIFAIAASALLANTDFYIKETYGDVNGSNVELILNHGDIPIYVEAKAMQESAESIERQQMVHTFQKLFSDDAQLKRKVALTVNFKRMLTNDQIKTLVEQIIKVLDDCAIPSSHNLDEATFSISEGNQIGMGFPFFDAKRAIIRISKRFNDAQAQIDRNGAGIIWIKLNWEEDVHSQVNEIINALEDKEYSHIVAVVFCEFEHWKCDKSSLYINPNCKANNGTAKQITNGIERILSTPWQNRYKWPKIIS